MKSITTPNDETSLAIRGAVDTHRDDVSMVKAIPSIWSFPRTHPWGGPGRGGPSASI